MSHPIPRRISQAKIASWWFPRGYPPGDLFDWFSTLIDACEAEFLPIRLEQIKRASAAGNKPPAATIKAGDDD